MSLHQMTLLIFNSLLPNLRRRTHCRFLRRTVSWSDVAARSCRHDRRARFCRIFNCLGSCFRHNRRGLIPFSCRTRLVDPLHPLFDGFALDLLDLGAGVFF